MEIIVTNNPRVRDAYSANHEIHFISGDFSCVLIAARDLIHKGFRLLTHPLSGSVKPNETPFKSILLCSGSGIDLPSLSMIENALDACRKFPIKYPEMPDAMRDDFSLIDYTLFSSAI